MGWKVGLLNALHQSNVAGNVITVKMLVSGVEVSIEKEFPLT